MSNFENAPIDVKATSFATVIRLNAIIATLPEEQRKKYDQIIAEEKEKALVHLRDLLTPEELENFVQIL